MLMFNFCCKYLNLKMFALKSNHYKNGLEIKTTVIKTIEDVLANFQSRDTRGFFVAAS